MHLCLCVGRQWRAQEGCGPLCLLLLSPFRCLCLGAGQVPCSSGLSSSHLEGEEDGSPGGSPLRALLAYIF